MPFINHLLMNGGQLANALPAAGDSVQTAVISSLLFGAIGLCVVAWRKRK